ncbi:MAG: hypothetical protein PHD81_01795 [Candidatus Nanoarchaeia archaeon]|nr:hypothetical protein [Candidatus Nanoarchaeia archaeon]MDD5587822.1 hypothetical protein [Candidatus Nanoarchaeia archaeon]
MTKNEGECRVCGTKYVVSEHKVQSDSHFFYEEYFRCPSCNYNPELDNNIREILFEKIRLNITIGPKKPILSFNKQELEGLILEEIKKCWPEVKK